MVLVFYSCEVVGGPSFSFNYVLNILSCCESSGVFGNKYKIYINNASFTNTLGS